MKQKDKEAFISTTQEIGEPSLILWSKSQFYLMSQSSKTLRRLVTWITHSKVACYNCLARKILESKNVKRKPLN